MMLSVLALSKCGKVLVGQMRLPKMEQLFWKSLRSVNILKVVERPHETLLGVGLSN